MPRWNVASGNGASADHAHRHRQQISPTTGTGTHPAGTIAASADQRPEQQRTPRRLPWPFSFAAPSPACHLPGLPDQQPGARWALSAAAPGKSWKVPGERWTQCMDIAPTTCTGKDQHRQRRTDDPAAHKLHSLHTLPDLTAASSPPPAPTDTAPRQPCRPPAAADHPANSQKPPTAAHRRRGQILYLTGIWPLQYSQ